MYLEGDGSGYLKVLEIFTM